MNPVAKAAVKEYVRSKKRRKHSCKYESDSDSESDYKSSKIKSSLLCTHILPVLTPNNSSNPIKNTHMIAPLGKSEMESRNACFSDLSVNSGSTSLVDTEINVSGNSPRTICTGSGKTNSKINKNKIRIKKTNKHKPTRLRSNLVARSKSTLKKFKDWNWTPVVELLIDGVKLTALLDSGASHSLIATNKIKVAVNKTKPRKVKNI